MRANRRPVDRRGVAATELALLLPVLTLVLFIGADYARLFYALATLGDSARAGALHYAMHPSAAQTAVEQAALADASNLAPTPTVTTGGGTITGGHAYVQVTVSYSFQTLIPQPGITSPITLSRTVVMLANPF